MKYCSPFCAGIWPFLLLPLLLLIPVLFFSWQSIEAAVATNAQQSLDTQQVWAKAETFNRGRDVLLIGTAPDSDAIEAAKQLSLAATGVRKVTFAGKIGAPKPPEFSLGFSDGAVNLSGTVADVDTVEQLTALANASFADRTINNELQVGNNFAALLPMNDLISTSASLEGVSELAISGDNLVVNGVVESWRISADYSKRLSKVFTGQVDNRIEIYAPPVENDECQDLLDELLVKARINFRTGDATISKNSQPLIEDIAETARRCPEASFEVAGYADATGSAEFNLVLSQRRAQAVADRLVSMGLDGQRFSAKGYGLSQAIGDNSTAAGRAANRRIEFKLKDEGE
ncbi:MAG: OmpA family protein [Pseudomonadota bacterium]